jgi:hypothetical protein
MSTSPPRVLPALERLIGALELVRDTDPLYANVAGREALDALRELRSELAREGFVAPVVERAEAVVETAGGRRVIPGVRLDKPARDAIARLRAEAEERAERARRGELPPAAEPVDGHFLALAGLHGTLLRIPDPAAAGWPADPHRAGGQALVIAGHLDGLRGHAASLRAECDGARPAGGGAGKRRRRQANRPPVPLTEKQVEAMELVGQHKGDVAAAARAAGKSRAAMMKLYGKALKKLGRKAPPAHRTQRLPTDIEGQDVVAAGPRDRRARRHPTDRRALD